MKKSTIIVFLGLLIAGQLNAQNWDLWFFRGIEAVFSKDTSGNNVTALMTPIPTQAQFVKDKINAFVDVKTNAISTNDRFIVAHSQGGLRAMAYYDLLKKDAQQSKIKGILTIGSPIRGYWPLQKGIEGLRKDVLSITDTLAQALAIVILGEDDWPSVVPGQPNANSTVKMLYHVKTQKGLLWATLRESIDLVRLLDEDPLLKMFGYTTEQLGQMSSSLGDMRPGSTPGTSPADGLTTNYKVWLGSFSGDQTKNVLTQFKPTNGGTIEISPTYYNSNYQRVYQVYENYSVTTAISAKSPANFLDSSVYLGYLVGTNKDVEQMLLDAAGNGMTKKTLQGYKNAIGFAFGTKRADLLRSFSWEWLTLNFSLGNRYFIMFNKVGQAWDMMDNLSEEFHRRIYGTNSSDGFIPERDQSNDEDFGGKKFLDDGKYFRKIFPELNHVTEKKHPVLWGTDYSESKKVGMDQSRFNDGYLYRNLLSIGIDKTEGKQPEY